MLRYDGLPLAPLSLTREDRAREITHALSAAKSLSSGFAMSCLAKK
jgi:hypothetical protein